MPTEPVLPGYPGLSVRFLSSCFSNLGMWNPPSPTQLERLPRLYSTEDTPLLDKLIYEHFFIAGCDWYAAEYDPQNRLFFGYAILNGDLDNSEWGLIPLDELKKVRVRGIEIDRDLHWQVRKASEVDRIIAAYRHQRLL